MWGGGRWGANEENVWINAEQTPPAPEQVRPCTSRCQCGPACKENNEKAGKPALASNASFQNVLWWFEESFALCRECLYKVVLEPGNLSAELLFMGEILILVWKTESPAFSGSQNYFLFLTFRVWCNKVGTKDLIGLINWKSLQIWCFKMSSCCPVWEKLHQKREEASHRICEGRTSECLRIFPINRNCFITSNECSSSKLGGRRDIFERVWV